MGETTDAEEILSLIESVDLTDTQTLDKIDCLVWSLVKPPEAMQFDRQWHPYYTRSRDALKGIRPNDWKWSFKTSDIFRCQAWGFKEGVKISKSDFTVSAEGNTEELAELSAIIQAIEYERGRK